MNHRAGRAWLLAAVAAAFLCAACRAPQPTPSGPSPTPQPTPSPQPTPAVQLVSVTALPPDSPNLPPLVLCTGLDAAYVRSTLRPVIEQAARDVSALPRTRPTEMPDLLDRFNTERAHLIPGAPACAVRATDLALAGLETGDTAAHRFIAQAETPGHSYDPSVSEQMEQAADDCNAAVLAIFHALGS